MGTAWTANGVSLLLLLASLAAGAVASTEYPKNGVLGSSTSLAFPATPNETESTALASVIASDLGLGGVVSIRGELYDIQDSRNVWFDGLNNYVPMRGYGPPAAPQEVYTAVTGSGASIQLHYNTTYPTPTANGSFLFADLQNYPVALPANSSAKSFLSGVATSLGIRLDGNETVFEYSYGTNRPGDKISATLYRPIAGKPVAFGSQIVVRAWTSNGTVEILRLFPWIASAPAASFDEPTALAEAASTMNATLNGTRLVLSSWATGWALDPRGYFFAYSVRLAYLPKATGEGTLSTTVWLDVQTGAVLLIDTVGVATSGPPPALPLYALLYPFFFVAVTVITITALALRTRRSEASAIWVLAAIGYPFYALRKERALEHFVRGQMYEYLRIHSGATFSDIRDELSLRNGAAAHHLMVLERMGFIVSRRNGHLKHFFRSDTPTRIVARMLSPLQYDILDLIAKGHLSQTAVAKQIGVSRQRANYNVRNLQKRGLLEVDSRDRLLMITDEGVSLLNPGPRDRDVMPES